MQSLKVNVGPIHLVLSQNVLLKLYEKKFRYSHLPEAIQIQADFQVLNSQEGVPAAIKQHEGKDVLLLYTSTYFLGAYPSNRNDGYRIAYIDPLNLGEHERLAKGVLMLRGPGWYIHGTLPEIPRGSSNYWGPIRNTWHYLENQSRQAKIDSSTGLEMLTPAHENFLNTIGTLVEVTRKLEQDKNKLPMMIPYGKVESAGEERYAPRDVYIFNLSGSPEVNEKNLLRIKEAPYLRGRVFALKGNKLTVKFEGMIDSALIPPQGNFEPIVSEAVYRTQQEAIETLREGESKNTRLLRVLVDNSYQSYQGETMLPSESLNSEQLEAFRRGLAVPDLLLVLGPPGTGKTRTITEIVRQCGARRQRVLVTSSTHKAVDNVLERLSSTGNLTTVRLGHEDRIAESIRPLLIDEQAKDLQKAILQQTEADNQKLSNFVTYKSTIDQWVNQLTRSITSLKDNERQMHAVLQRRTQAIQRIEALYRPKLDELTRSLQDQKDTFIRHHSKMNAQLKKRIAAESRSQMPVFGAFFRWLSRYYHARSEEEQRHISNVKRLHEAARREYTSVQESLQCVFVTDPEYQWCEDNLWQIGEHNNRFLQSASRIANTLKETVLDLIPAQPELAPLNVDTLQKYVTWYNATRAILERRATLLRDWRKELESRTEQINPEMLHYADVVGATCIGVATAKGLEDLEFDLAIVDEAGQISLPELLVPLVRAKRAVLVGDYHQLPPFVDSQVQTWLDGLSPQTQQTLGITDEETDSEQITELLTKSAFEQLFMKCRSNVHIVRFTEQRRMPKIIADFASQHFYEGLLRTFEDDKSACTTHSDPLFQQPLAFIDTSGLPFKDRKERSRQASESWGETGYVNQAEATLIARIALVYEHEGVEWVIIVPYRAQAHLIIRLLGDRIETPDFRLKDRVATVDSFQGGEKDKVIYGFTRSNDRGSIGFLKELRRLNVAMTRAKQQLVLVGDLSTLTRAGDADFRRLVLSLQGYTWQRGELLSYQECHNRLTIKR